MRWLRICWGIPLCAFSLALARCLVCFPNLCARKSVNIHIMCWNVQIILLHLGNVSGLVLTTVITGHPKTLKQLWCVMYEVCLLRSLIDINLNLPFSNGQYGLGSFDLEGSRVRGQGSGVKYLFTDMESPTISKIGMLPISSSYH